MSKISPSTEDVQQLYDAWADENVYPHFIPSDYREIFSVSPLLSTGPQRILDVGCGEGFVAAFLKAQGHHVTGFDLSAKAVDKAKKFGRIDEGIVGNIYDSKIADGSFDVVVFFGVLLHIFDLEKAFSEAHRILRPGGEVVVMDHHRRNPYTKLHFVRPNWIDRILEGRDNIGRRALDEKMIYSATGPNFAWYSPRYLSCYTVHPNRTVNTVHNWARDLFGSIRRLSQAPWTGNILAMGGQTRRGEA
ncbi:MAG: class I SAM-dependent methyltransferase [Bdellovibrionales bacterium]|nr:class I SAM-dependent methyltransferase [Bdellovibrionales bacterium]